MNSAQGALTVTSLKGSVHPNYKNHSTVQYLAMQTVVVVHADLRYPSMNYWLQPQYNGGEGNLVLVLTALKEDIK